MRIAPRVESLSLTTHRLISSCFMAFSAYRATPSISAEDGQQALDKAFAHLPDLILLDIQMPDIEGYDVCLKLKENAQTRDIPVIFISALSDTDEIVKGFNVGGVDYVTKPFRLKEVLARVANQLIMVQQRKQIEALRQQDRQYFKSLDNMKNQFIRMATHDLRNPLNIIVGYAALLEEIHTPAPSDKELLDQAVQNIQDSVQRMRSLVTDMLDMAQLEIKATLQVRTVPLAIFLERTLKGFKVVASQKQIELVYSPPPPDVFVSVDTDRMARVVDNLVSNAIKYTASGGRVEVSARAEGDTVIVQVTDTGFGIPEEDMPHIFDPFYRVDSDRHQAVEGTGLGLSVVKTIVEQHNGQVYVQSELDRGSTFSVHLKRLTEKIAVS